MHTPATDPESVFVLGAGIQGVCAALALSRAGRRVTLVDEAPDCLLRTSLVNEGKIHLGHVYANDATFRTSALMLEAALAFAPLVERFVGHPVDWPSLRSKPFTYLVASNSLVGTSQVFDHYERLNQHYQEIQRAGNHYVGQQLEALWQPAPVPAAVNPQFTIAAAQTPEVSVDPQQFREVLRAAVAASPIDTLYGHTVTEVSRTSCGFRVAGVNASGPWERRSTRLVNCLWTGRLAIDAQLGLLPAHRRAYRLKHRVFVDLPLDLADLPSITIVLGPFGDLVTYPHRRTAYISWYPACMRDWCSDMTVPQRWHDAASGAVDAATMRAVADASLEAFDTIVPGMRRCTNPRVAAGVIFAWGASDIDDPASQLHERHEIGVHALGQYYSIDTGKFTCAPLFADALVRQMDASR